MSYKRLNKRAKVSRKASNIGPKSRLSEPTGYLVVVADSADKRGAVFMKWVPPEKDVIGKELRRVQYGNPEELSLIAFGRGTRKAFDRLLKTLGSSRISNRDWFVRSTPVETLISYLRGESKAIAA